MSSISQRYDYYRITESPFYDQRNVSQVMDGKKKAGTNYYLKYLIFGLVVKGHRYLVGFYPLTQPQLPRLVNLITQELVWLKKRSLCDRILLDRGFNNEKMYNLIVNRVSNF